MSRRWTIRIFEAASSLIMAVIILAAREIGAMAETTLYLNRIATWRIFPESFGGPVDTIRLALEVIAAIFILKMSVRFLRENLASISMILGATTLVYLAVDPIAEMVARNILPGVSREVLPGLGEWLPRFAVLETLPQFYGGVITAMLAAGAEMIRQWIKPQIIVLRGEYIPQDDVVLRPIS